MIRIIYGCAKSGKSERIYQLMKEDAMKNSPSYLVVPEQETVFCERKLLDILPPSAQLTSEVLNFSRLANLVFRTYGGLSYNYADKGSKTLIMWKNLKELAPLLTEYSRSAENNASALAGEMLSAISELKAYCVTPTKLEKAAERLEDNEILKNKLLDLSLIFASYQNYFNESFSDATDDLSKLAETLQNHDFFRDANVYIDSFTSFTAQEYAVIKEIFRSAKNVTVALTLDTPASMQIHYESTANTAFNLIRLAKELNLEIGEEKLEEADKEKSVIDKIATSLWTPDACTSDRDVADSIRIIKCSDPYEEAEAAANAVLRLMMQGVRCRDIALIARDASVYRGIIDDIFEKANIPYFFSQNTNILSKSPVKFILSALKIKLYNWRGEDVISYLKAGVAPIEDRDVDLLECYLSVWNIRGSAFLSDEWTMNPDGYTERLTDRGREILRRVNSCKNEFVPPLVRLFTRIDEAADAKEMCRALYLFMEEHEMAKILSEKAEEEYRLGNRKEAAELLQVYNSIVKALQNLSVSLGDADITPKEFYEAIKIMLDNVSVGSIPTAEDQVVIGSASMLRTSEKKCAVVIGLNEGEFPQNVKESGVFSDRDKRLLDELGISLSPNTSSRAADELFYVYRALTSPSDKLILLYHESDLSGKATPPSLAIQRIKKLFQKIEEKSFSELPYEEKLVARELAFERLPYIKGTPEGDIISAYFDAFETYREKIEGSDIPSQNKECTLTSETVDSVYGKNLRLTQSIIDNYVGCPFEYMCQRLFALNDISPASFDYANFGTYIHYIFENYLKTASKDGMIGKAPDTAYIEKTVNAIADDYIKSFFSSGEMDSPRLSYRLKRMRRLATLVATNLTREFENSEFRPKFFELGIGKVSADSSVSPVKIPIDDKRNAFIVGKVDRVDVWKNENEIFIKVVDYKSGKKAFSKKDLEKGQNVQLPLYLFALCDDQQEGFRRALEAADEDKILPAGALYISSLIEPIEVDEKSYDKNAVLEEAEASIDRSGFLVSDPTVLTALDSELSPQYLCGAKKDKNGNPSGSALIPYEELYDLNESLKDTITGIARTMTSGCMNADPSISNNKFRCENCKMRAVCRAKR